MPPTPTMLPAATRDALARAAVPAVLDAAGYAVLDGEGRRRKARDFLLRDVEADDSLDRKLRQGAAVLLDAAEKGTGLIVDAGIDAAMARAKCPCGPTFVRVLKALADLAIQAAFAGLREAGKV